MGGPLSAMMADIFMVKMENDIVKPMNPLFYKRYVDDIIYRRKIENEDRFLKSLNSYHPKFNFTVEVNPAKFLVGSCHYRSQKAVQKAHSLVIESPQKVQKKCNHRRITPCNKNFKRNRERSTED